MSILLESLKHYFSTNNLCLRYLWELPHSEYFLSMRWFNYPLTIMLWWRFKILPLTLSPNKPWFLRVCRPSLLKTLWEKEKLFITTHFSLFRCFFYPLGELSAIFIKYEIVVCRLFESGWVYNLSFGKGLTVPYFIINLFPNKHWFLRVCGTSLMKTLWEKKKLLVTSNFSFSHSFSTRLENFLAILI